MPSAVCLLTPFRMSSVSREEDKPPEAHAIPRLRSQTRGSFSFALGESSHKCDGSCPQTGEIANRLARKICKSLSIPEIG
jgi:hypothetical protein